MRVLVVGASGQVGASVVRHLLTRSVEVIAGYSSRPVTDPAIHPVHLDKCDAQECERVVETTRPDAVVDTAALHNVDHCERHPEEARRVNRDGSANLAQAAARNGARTLFVSTDYVFGEPAGAPFREDSSPVPRNVYARSKLEGELAVLSASERNLVVRPAIIYSWVDTRRRASSSSGKAINFGTWLVEEVSHGRPVRIVTDQVGSPTLAADLAGAIVALLDSGAAGLFHAAGRTSLSRYEFAVRLVRHLDLDTALISPVATADLSLAASRPANATLDSSRLERVTGYRMMEIGPQLDAFARDVRADPGFRLACAGSGG